MFQQKKYTANKYVLYNKYYISPNQFKRLDKYMKPYKDL